MRSHTKIKSANKFDLCPPNWIIGSPYSSPLTLSTLIHPTNLSN